MIREDKSYMSKLDLKAIEKGIAKLDIYSLRIDREQYTEEQKEENKKLADSVSRDEWSKHCDDVKKRIAQKIEPLIESLSNKFNIYQYKNNSIEYGSNWDLFFWCNCNKEGQDFSYVTLSTNKKRTVEERSSDIKKVLEYIQEIGFKGIDVIIQYTATYNEEVVKNIALNYFNQIQNNVVKCFGYDGKIKNVGTDNKGNIYYGFFKKGARSKYYRISDMNLLEMAIAAV